MPRFIRAADIQEIPPGHSKVLRVQDREIALFNANGTYYAVKNSCPHRGVALDRGTVENTILTCPGHAWQFDLRTGDAVDHPPAGVRCYRVEIHGGSVWIEVP